MRILHLPKWYPNRYDDQDGNFVAQHIQAIEQGDAPGTAPLSMAVVFAAVARSPLPHFIEFEAVVENNIPTWRYYYRSRITGIRYLDKLLKLVLWLVCMQRGLRAVRQHWHGKRPEVVHAHVLFRTAVLAWWLKRRHRTPYLLTEHWTAFLPVNAARLGWFRRQMAGFLVRQADAVTPVSEDLRQALARLGATNLHTTVIPNAVDMHVFRLPATPEPRHGLLHVAAFNEQAKNLSGILRTVASLRTAHPKLHVQLRIAGYGPAEAQLHQLAKSLGLLADGTVTFLGKLSPAELALEMQRAQALVLFSNYENLPCVLIEAQASGLPAVATRVNGIPELLPDDGSRGLLVPPQNEAALAHAIQTILQAPPHQYDATKLREAAVSRFSYPAVGAAFRQLYHQVLGRR
ncbi:glycosyltransferase family 4 protein [Hymenobacter seoulensis]